MPTSACMNQIERILGMHDRVWARHANPWSVWTRLPILPLICIAIWARVWIGALCLLPIALLAIWIWLNPRAFPPPAKTDAWSSRAVMGERVWLARKTIPIPQHHVDMALVTAVISGVGMIPLIYGLWALDPWATIAGCATTMLGKLWFLDRMVWLLSDMDTRPPNDERGDP